MALVAHAAVEIRVTTAFAAVHSGIVNILAKGGRVAGAPAGILPDVTARCVTNGWCCRLRRLRRLAVGHRRRRRAPSERRAHLIAPVGEDQRSSRLFLLFGCPLCAPCFTCIRSETRPLVAEIWLRLGAAADQANENRNSCGFHASISSFGGGRRALLRGPFTHQHRWPRQLPNTAMAMPTNAHTRSTPGLVRSKQEATAFLSGGIPDMSRLLVRTLANTPT